MKIRQSRLKQIINEEIERFNKKTNINKVKIKPNKFIALLEELDKNGDKN